MGSLEISSKTLEKYFSFLNRLNNNTKKRLINKLTKSLKINSDSTFDLKSLYGAWNDNKDSDTIIQEIKNSRVESDNRSSL